MRYFDILPYDLLDQFKTILENGTPDEAGADDAGTSKPEEEQPADPSTEDKSKEKATEEQNDQTPDEIVQDVLTALTDESNSLKISELLRNMFGDKKGQRVVGSNIKLDSITTQNGITINFMNGRACDDAGHMITYDPKENSFNICILSAFLKALNEKKGETKRKCLEAVKHESSKTKEELNEVFEKKQFVDILKGTVNQKIRKRKKKEEQPNPASDPNAHEQGTNPNDTTEPTGEEQQQGEQTGPTGAEQQQQGEQTGPTGAEQQQGEQTGPTGAEQQQGEQNGPTGAEQQQQGEQTGPTGAEPQQGEQTGPTGAEPQQGEQTGPTGTEPQQGEQTGPTGTEQQQGEQTGNQDSSDELGDGEDEEESESNQNDQQQSEAHNDAAECPFCHGSDKNCEVCGGSGKVKKCPTCNGTCTDPSTQQDCEQCHGNGYIPLQQKQQNGNDAQNGQQAEQKTDPNDPEKNGKAKNADYSNEIFAGLHRAAIVRNEDGELVDGELLYDICDNYKKFCEDPLSMRADYWDLDPVKNNGEDYVPTDAEGKPALNAQKEQISKYDYEDKIMDKIDKDLQAVKNKIVGFVKAGQWPRKTEKRVEVYLKGSKDDALAKENSKKKEEGYEHAYKMMGHVADVFGGNAATSSRSAKDLE